MRRCVAGNEKQPTTAPTTCPQNRLFLWENCIGDLRSIAVAWYREGGPSDMKGRLLRFSVVVVVVR